MPDPLGRADEFEAGLRRLVSRRGYDVVLSTDDATLARLASLNLPAPTLPDVGAGFRVLTDKIALAPLCATAGVPYPATSVPDEVGAVRAMMDSLGSPVVVKSARSAEAGPQRVSAARGATVCHDASAAEVAVRELLQSALRPILQSRIRSAGKLNAVIIRREGASQFRYSHRVLREAPRSGGVGVTLVTIPADHGPGAEAVDLLERVCDAANYSGLAQAEFYRSADDGRLYLLDVNPRLWGSTWFAERQGLRVVERGVRFAMGLPPLPPAEYQVGRVFHQPVGEWRWLREHDRKLAGVLELVRTTRPTDVFDYLDWRDPAPVAAYPLHLIRERIAGLRSR